MKETVAEIIKYLFLAFCAVLIIWTASLSLDLMTQVLPGNNLFRYFSVALFDGGALLFFLTFLYSAKGKAQRAIALTMMIVDLFGVALMAGGDLWLRQTFVDIPPMIGTITIWTVTVATVLNAVSGIYAYHLADPFVMAKIKDQTDMDNLLLLAEKKYTSKLGEIADKLAEEMADVRFRDAVSAIRNDNASGDRPAQQSPPVSQPPKRKRGRPPGSRNKVKSTMVQYASDVDGIDPKK